MFRELPLARVQILLKNMRRNTTAFGRAPFRLAKISERMAGIQPIQWMCPFQRHANSSCLSSSSLSFMLSNHCDFLLFIRDKFFLYNGRLFKLPKILIND
jgi:hypothetical protein